ncbi:5-formyltetrahydrofolate cyclo-ligase [Wenzhouxiangella limi]|uniref:5-formyltetrahydrofolate cyclo-ligase n=1 Tax=Wenzhouxiangella limi TaxID=2707351 RepID=A0A845V5Z4_9GAMM|nr:5-formyltetrahydrofolate cyclo-ligase [Wenzhouxiangella limi]NDY96596.1 5-formyltetrahydrofolate cyclo-ligase [Wenzhouxiangella limi]
MSEDTSTQPAKRALREMLLAQRLALPEARRRVLDRQLCAQVLGFMAERPGVRVAAFLPFRGEPDLRPALHVLQEAGRDIHLPVLVDAAMEFRRWESGEALVANRFGIPEPAHGRLCAPEQLDWVLMPLVAFSTTGTRLGMGGGFYDRSFAFRLQPGRPPGPTLVGVAYGLQEVNSLPAQHWDVPLDAIITDYGVREFRTQRGLPPAS